MLLPYMGQQKICSLNALYKPHEEITLCAVSDTYVNIMLFMNSTQPTVWPEALAYIYSHYLHMSLNEYACHIAHMCPTALILHSVYRSHSTIDFNKSTKPFSIYLSCHCHICQQQIWSSNETIYALHANYMKCPNVGSVRKYVAHMN